MKLYHRNTITSGPCHYYTLRKSTQRKVTFRNRIFLRTYSGRVIFRENEIRKVEGGIVELFNGACYAVTTSTPQLVTQESDEFKAWMGAIQ